MAIPPNLPERRSTFWSAPRERIYVQVIHWTVVIVVVIATFVLALRGDLDRASVTAIFGTVVGHAGTAAVNRATTRSTDHPARSNATDQP